MGIPKLHEEAYFRDFVPHEGGILERLEKEAKEKNVPIIGPVLGRLLYILARTTGARRILELGTATGYSAIWLAKAASEVGGKITTVEFDPEMARRAQRNMDEAGFSDTIELIQGDARMIVASFEGQRTFDMAFIDVEKEFYSPLLDPTVKLLRSAGILFFDNTAFVTGGDILKATFEHPMLETVHLYGYFPDHSPDNDAITICVKR